MNLLEVVQSRAVCGVVDLRDDGEGDEAKERCVYRWRQGSISGWLT